MKKSAVAVLLAAAITIFPASGAIAFASAATDASPTYTLSAGDGFSYKESSFTDSGGTQKMFTGEYKPSENSEYELVIHSIFDRKTAKTTKTTVMDVAKDYEQTTGRKVIMAVNGDYFDLNTGTNVESYVNDGVVISKGAYNYKHCIGFDNNGKVTVGRLTDTSKKILVEKKNGEKKFFDIDKFNESPGDNEIAVYNKAGTYQVSGAGKYLLKTDSANLTQYPVWGLSQRTAMGTVTNDDEFTVKSSQFAIVVKGENAQYFYDNLVYGTDCSLVETPDGSFKGCNWVLGGYDILVNNGTVNTSCHTDNDGNGYAPRTFVGFKADGTAIITVLDGRQGSYAKGITVAREATLAKELGAVNALELDGGGSSTVILRVNDELTLRNKPSDGSMRKISNALLLVEKPKAEQGGTTTPTTPGGTEPTTPVTPAPAGGCGSTTTGLSMSVSVFGVACALFAVVLIKRKGAKK